MPFFNKDRTPSLSAAGLLTFLLLFLVQCDSNNSSRPLPSDDVTSILSQFDGTTTASLDLEAMVAIGDSALRSLAGFDQHQDADMRWATVMSLGAIGRQLNKETEAGQLIMEYLDDPDIWVKVTAAELSASLGFKEGIPVLIDAVDSDLHLKLSEPPSPIATQAASVLTLYTGQDFMEEALWWDWWDQNQNDLEWNPDNEMFE